MKKSVVIITLLLFAVLLKASDFKIWFNPYPGIDDEAGAALCSAVKETLAQSKELDVVLDDNPDHVYNFTLWTLNPGGAESGRTCFVYEVHFCVQGLPKLYVNSYVELTTSDHAEKTARYLVSKLLEDAALFYEGYPQYKGKGTVFKSGQD